MRYSVCICPLWDFNPYALQVGIQRHLMDCPDASEDEAMRVRDVMVVANTLRVPGVGASAVVTGSNYDSEPFQEAKLELRTRNCDFAPVATEVAYSCHNCSRRAEAEVHRLRIENEHLREQVSHLERVIRVQLSEQDQEIKRQSAEVKSLSQLNGELSQHLLMYQVAVAVLTMNGYDMK